MRKIRQAVQAVILITGSDSIRQGYTCPGTDLGVIIGRYFGISKFNAISLMNLNRFQTIHRVIGIPDITVKCPNTSFCSCFDIVGIIDGTFRRGNLNQFAASVVSIFSRSLRGYDCLCSTKIIISKGREDVFYYVYGVLHNQTYRKRFSADLKKKLPHIPFPDEYKVFKAYCKAGRELASLHLNYETGPFCKTVIVSGCEHGKYRVQKMRFISKDDKRTIIFNEFIRIENIPLVAYDYVINGKSAIEWVMERYSITTNSDSGILNDPNQWSENPRYIFDLLLRIIQMSIDTVQIVTKLPEMNFPG